MKKKTKDLLKNLILIIVALGALVFLIWYLGQPVEKNSASDEDIESGLIGETIVNQGADHVQPSEVQSFEYSTNPPVSGPHDATSTDWGVYETQPFVGSLIHSLEHGAINIYYSCENIGEGCEEAVSELNAIYKELEKKDPKVILTPFEDMEHKIALGAWDHLLTLEFVDQDRIEKFFNQFINQGPEKITR